MAKTPPAVPIAAAASAISQTGFTAVWSSVPDATDYRLDISADNFATFVTGYNSKTVTSFNDVVSGLTAATTYKYRVRSSNSNGVSANSNEITVTTSAAPVITSAVATLGGATFTATTSKAIDTGAGLELVLADASNKITLSLSDKTAGTYTAVNSSTGRTAALSYSISVLKDGVTYNGVTGTLLITANADGTFTATFDGTLKSSTGLTLSLSSGKLLNFSVVAAPTSGCRITAITTSYGSNCDGAYGANFYYNGDGRLSKITYPDGAATYSYDVTGKLVGISGTGSGGGETYELAYSGTVLSSVKRKHVSTTSSSTRSFTISYSAGSTISSVTYTDTNSLSQITETGSNTLTFVDGNLTSDKDVSIYSFITSTTTNTYSGYDTKKNPWALLASLTGTPISFAYDGGDDLGYFDFFSLSVNNPGTRVRSYSTGSPNTHTFTYTYNAQNYPSQMVYKYTTDCSITYNFTYSGCQ